MLRLSNRLSRFRIIVLFCSLILSSCDFFDLRQITVRTEPSGMDSLLPESYSPVVIRFNTGMIKNEVEGIVHISSDLGTMSTDKFWIENNLYVKPVGGWTPGIRYTLSLRGTVRSTDGRDLRVEHFVSFFAVSRNALPVLQWHSPYNGASVSTNDMVFEFHFSRPMNRLSVETALSIDGISGRTFEWYDDYKILKVIPDRVLSPWVLHSWNLRDSARAADGVPLARSYSGYFTTNLDQTLPHIVNIFPVLFSGGNWYPTGAPIETGLGVGQGIAVEFNKPMGESALRSLRFEPSLTGRTEFLSEQSVVFIFTRDPDPETVYTLIVSGDARDREGLSLGSDFRLNFTPDIPILDVLSFSSGGGVFYIKEMANNVIPVRVDPATGELNFILQFSLLFDFEERLNAPQRITVSPFFPRTLPPIALQFVSWISDDRLLMRWEGLEPKGNTPHYYRLVIPGGRGGINSALGIYMLEDVIVLLRAIE